MPSRWTASSIELVLWEIDTMNALWMAMKTSTEILFNFNYWNPINNYWTFFDSSFVIGVLMIWMFHVCFVAPFVFRNVWRPLCWNAAATKSGWIRMKSRRSETRIRVKESEDFSETVSSSRNPRRSILASGAASMPKHGGRSVPSLNRLITTRWCWIC